LLLSALWFSSPQFRSSRAASIRPDKARSIERRRVSAEPRPLHRESPRPVSSSAPSRKDRRGIRRRERESCRKYPADCVLVFNRDLRGCARGERGKLIGISAKRLALELNGNVQHVPLTDLDHINVCRERALALSPGDRLQLKANSTSVDGRKLANGKVVTVAHIKSSGAIRLTDGRVLPPPLSTISPRVCRHVVRIARQDCRSCLVLRFRHSRGDERAAMVCHHLARPKEHPNLHAGEAATATVDHAQRRARAHSRSSFSLRPTIWRAPARTLFSSPRTRVRAPHRPCSDALVGGRVH